MQLAQAFRRLEAESRRITPQREGIVRLFAAHPEALLSAEEVRQRIRQQHGEVGLATVYRTLDLLTVLKVLRRVEQGAGGARYGWNPAPLHQGVRLVCVRCGHAEEWAEDPLESWETAVALQMGFQTLDHEVTVRGLCVACAGTRPSAGGNHRDGGADVFTGGSGGHGARRGQQRLRLTETASGSGVEGTAHPRRKGEEEDRQMAADWYCYRK